MLIIFSFVFLIISIIYCAIIDKNIKIFGNSVSASNLSKFNRYQAITINSSTMESKEIQDILNKYIEGGCKFERWLEYHHVYGNKVMLLFKC